MKTKKFLMTSLLVMGMIIARAANGFPPELVLVSQPVLTYNANSVTIYYDVQNIGDYTYRGDLYIYLDPDDGYCYGREYMRVCPGRIKRVEVTIPAYRPNPSWTYTVMPYYELNGVLYSFTAFEYFEPIRFCWYGYRDEPWVVIHVGPRPRYYHRPTEYRFYYDGYYPTLPPPPPGGPGHPRPMPPMDPAHHTYGYHHNNGGYPANHYTDHPTPGYNTHSEAEVRPHGSNTPGSMSSRSDGYVAPKPNNGGSSSSGATVHPHNSNGNSGATVRPNNNSGGSSSSSSSGRTDSGSGNSGATVRPNNNSGSSSSSSSSGRTDSGSGNSGATVRPNSDSGSSSSSSSSGRTGSVSRSSDNNSGTGSSSSGRGSRSSSSSSSSGRSDRSGSSSRSGSGSSNSSSSSRSSGGRR